MSEANKRKSSIEEIREKFDQAVDLFSNLETGQRTAVDSPVFLELLTEAAKRLAPGAKSVLDIGCGAGNYTLKLLQKLPNLDCFFVDLSGKMLERAKERIEPNTSGSIETLQGDIAVLPLPENRFDIVLSGLALHHLREESDWRSVFGRVYKALKPGGVFLISDMVRQSSEILNDMMLQRYGEYLEEREGPELRRWACSSTENEDTPQSVFFQLRLMHELGFRDVDILHKNILFAALCGVK